MDKQTKNGPEVNGKIHSNNGGRKRGCCAYCCGHKVGDTDSDTDEKPQSSTCCGKCDCLHCCKRFTAFLFSHIGLCSLVVAYSIMGGYIFMTLEAPEEVITRYALTERRKYYVDSLWNMTYIHNVFDPANWSIKAELIVKDFQREVFEATKKGGWDGKDGDDQPQWSFPGALLYSVTVITTIGYGHIAPKTFYGRLVTMFYALFGIPLTLLCLANLGSFLGDCFRVFYKHACATLVCLCCPAHYQKSKHKKQLRTNKELHINEEGNPLKGKSLQNNRMDVSVTVEDVEIIKASEPIRVPIAVSLMLIATYIVGGAILFSQWENWEFLVGAYFCFTTLSTIGFGDYVPGIGSESLASKEKQIICAFYLVFGLSLIAMCFTLMQEEVRAKCRWLGQKLGLI